MPCGNKIIFIESDEIKIKYVYGQEWEKYDVILSYTKQVYCQKNIYSTNNIEEFYI